MSWFPFTRFEIQSPQLIRTPLISVATVDGEKKRNPKHKEEKKNPGPQIFNVRVSHWLPAIQALICLSTRANRLEALTSTPHLQFSMLRSATDLLRSRVCFCFHSRQPSWSIFTLKFGVPAMMCHGRGLILSSTYGIISCALLGLDFWILRLSQINFLSVRHHQSSRSLNERE